MDSVHLENEDGLRSFTRKEMMWTQYTWKTKMDYVPLRAREGSELAKMDYNTLRVREGSELSTLGL